MCDMTLWLNRRLNSPFPEACAEPCFARTRCSKYWTLDYCGVAPLVWSHGCYARNDKHAEENKHVAAELLAGRSRVDVTVALPS